MVNSSGNPIVIGDEKSDSSGLVGHPASETEATLISTFSPAVIGISNWLMFGTSAF